ncbi:RICIN domain-containing protein [Phanerochaete sordida]|uniref:RICIN domain-containing protein n=1 Tax=Phanerochaete sordida TaxID=48140 RepID=A0A9P3GRW8_9APHY|nr:RICIN domain-containing protein [Phanerochaete sordida]
MGNQQSNSSEPTPSIRSRASKRTRINIEEPSNRASRAVSFYQTPPGSFDTPRMSTASPLPESPITSTGNNTPLRPLSTVSEQISRTASGSEHKSDDSGVVTEEPKDTVKLVMKQKRSWSPGVYSLVNAKSGTAADLSGGDGRSIIGYPLHSGKNQQWNFESFGDGYTIRSVFSGLYLTMEDTIGDGAVLVASSFPVSWKIEDVSNEDVTSIRILWPTGKYAFALADGGSITPGTKIHLSTANADEPSQRWNLIERDVSPVDLAHRRSPHLEGATASPPLETVFVTEDKDHVVTTRTTTTSTVTTVTTVTKMPKGPQP